MRFSLHWAISAAVLATFFAGCAADNRSTPDAQTSSTAAHQDEGSGPWNVIVLSDIHVNTKPVHAEARFLKLVSDILEGPLPDFVVVTGDSTNGNAKRGESLKLIRSWWAEALRALSVFCDAGIPVFIVAGNHDYEEEPHKQAYREAWEKLRACNAKIALIPGGKPEAYSFNYRGVHFQLAHIEDKKLEPGYEEWMRADLARNQDQSLRLVFGHVPLLSVMNAKSNRMQSGFRNQLGAILADGHADAYIAGHEHLIWDEQAQLDDGRSVRQVIVGTASATYRYGLHRERIKAHCSAAKSNGKRSTVSCKFPCDARCFQSRYKDCPCTEFEADLITGIQEGRQAFARLSFSGARGEYDLRHYTVDGVGEIVPFGINREPAAMKPARSRIKASKPSRSHDPLQ